MNVELDPELEAAIEAFAERIGSTIEQVVASELRVKFAPAVSSSVLPTEQDSWHRLLRSAASDCGVSLPDEAFSREELYD